MDTLVSCANVVWCIHLALGSQAGLYDGGLVLEITLLEFIPSSRAMHLYTSR